MLTAFATVLVILGIFGLFLLARDPQVRTSKALWIPVLWLAIAGSRAITAWLQMGAVTTSDQYLEGSPLDRNIYIGIIVIGFLALLGRRQAIAALLRTNRWIVLFLLYCAVSIAWSDYPDVAFKRWIKALGDFVMVLIVLTDDDWVAAFKRLLTRVGFVLLPLSVLFIKYYPDLGRSFSRWEGMASFTGVATDKNMLGITCCVFGLGSSWQFLQELAGSRRSGILTAHGTVVAMTVWLLLISNSVTSLVCFLLASALVMMTFTRLGQRRFVVHLMVVAILLVCFAPLFLGVGGGLLGALGRDETLTGRTELWERLLGMGTPPILGVGFESFWLGERLKELWSVYWWHPNESHNGYLEMYLNLGWIGLAFLGTLILTGYRNVIRSLESVDRETGRLRLAYLVIGLAYNFTEAAFRTQSVMWIIFMLSIMALPAIAETSEEDSSSTETYQTEEVA